MGNGPIQVINTFTIKAGMIDDFVAVQLEARELLFSRVAGLRGSRLHRALDGSTAVLIAVFDTVEDSERFQQSEMFAAHRERLRPFIDGASPGIYELAYEFGNA